MEHFTNRNRWMVRKVNEEVLICLKGTKTLIITLSYSLAMNFPVMNHSVLTLAKYYILKIELITGCYFSWLYTEGYPQCVKCAIWRCHHCTIFIQPVTANGSLLKLL